MTRIFIIADDLTGAAEIGGIAFRHGLSAIIHHTGGNPSGTFPTAHADAIIIDSDTRHLPPAEAAIKVQSILQEINPADFDLIYKKTDSMLRGPVAAELIAAMNTLSFETALFIPQNPSRKRTIEAGHYFINGIPLHQSPVAIDVGSVPDTADVRLLLDPAGSLDIQCAMPGQSPLSKGITIGNASSAAHIAQWTTHRNPNTLLAGGADFFTALLKSLGPNPLAPPKHIPEAKHTLTIFGSASVPSRTFVASLCDKGLSICDVPTDPAALPASHDQLLAQLRSTGRAYLAARGAVDATRAMQIRQHKAELIARLLSAAKIDLLLIEGGATAAAIIQRLGWMSFDILAESAPGIVALRPIGRSSPVLILKPGTYPWPPDLLPTTGTPRS
jgi:uncharacterized protein YgbK (DUF1537 family)